LGGLSAESLIRAILRSLRGWAHDQSRLWRCDCAIPPVKRVLSLIFCIPLLGLSQSPAITTYVGPSLASSGSRANTQTIGVPQGIASDGAGGFYVASSTQNRIYRVARDGTLTVIAGIGSPGFSGDGGPAYSAQFNYVHGIAADGAGNVFIADTSNNRVRKVSGAGAITTVAGNGGWGLNGNGGAATSALLASPRGVAVDLAGNLFIADTGNNQIRKVSPEGVISAVAGTGSAGFSGDGGPAPAAQLNNPAAVAVDPAGNLFIADQNNNRIRMVNTAGVITTLAGHTIGFGGDGGSAVSAQLSGPRGVAADVTGNVFIADSGNNRVRMVDRGGIIRTVAGNTTGFSGDEGPALSAGLSFPVDVAADALGNIFIADRGNFRVRHISPDGVIHSAAGVSDDGGPANAAQLNYPNGIAVDAAGNLFIADTDSQRVRKISPDGIITTVAGNGTSGFRGDGGPASLAELSYPAAVAVAGDGHLYIADTRNQRIRRVTPDGIVTTIAGNGLAGFTGDGGVASLAQIDEPHGVAVDGSGNLFIADTNNQRVRKVSTDGIITTIAGNGTTGFSGDGGPAVSAQLASPFGLAADSAGNVFFADSSNSRIRRVSADGVISTAAGSGKYGFGGDGGAAPLALLASPVGVALDGAGNLFIADTDNQRIRKVSPEGIISTVAGNGEFGFSVDSGGSPVRLALPYSVAVDANNTLFIDDTYNGRIRRIGFTRTSSAASFVLAGGGGVFLSSADNSPSIQAGYGRIQTGTGSMPAALAIFSYRSGGYLVSETGVPATPPQTSGRIYAEVNGTVKTGLAIANSNNQTATIHFFYTDAEGNDLGSGATTIGPNQQIARFLNEAPFNTFGSPTFEGTFSIASDVPVGVVAIRGLVNERQDFLMSTLPVIDTTDVPGSNPLVVPHFADGNGWVTQILLINPTHTALAGTLEFRNDSGTLVNLSAGGQNSTTFDYSIPPRASYRLSSDGAGPITSGSVVVKPTIGVAPVPLAIFSNRTPGTIVSEAGVPSTSGAAFRVYVESSGSNGQPGNIRSGIAVTNNSTLPATITFELTNIDGSTTGALVSRDLPGLGHVAQFLDEFFPGLPNSFKGILRISTSSSAGVSVIGLRGEYNERAEFLMSTTPPISETRSSFASELVLPHLVDGGGYTTEFIVFNGAGAQLATGSLLLFQQSGEPLVLTLR
jgi:sugar lactone lactonase YvrE